MAYVILRTQKLKSGHALRRSLLHAFREQPTPNADENLTPLNSHIGAENSADALQKLTALLPEKRRKDAVLAIEYLVSGSPEAMKGKTREQQDQYFADALDWMRKKHGAQNVVYATIHRDEQTPHLAAYVVPLDPAGRLNCKHFLGGAKALNVMQTEFAREIGEPHGLERGIEGSKARHQSVSKFYSQISGTGPETPISGQDMQPKVTKRGMLKDQLETLEQIAQRLNDQVREAYAPYVAAAGLTLSERARADAAEKLAHAKAREAKEAQDALQTATEALGPIGELYNLDPAGFEHLRSAAAKRVAQLRQVQEIERDRQARIEALPNVLKFRAGAAYTMAEHAANALKIAGDPSKIVWGRVENSAIREAIGNGQEPADVFAAVLEVSPGMADPARRAKLKAEKLPASPRPAQDKGFDLDS